MRSRFARDNDRRRMLYDGERRAMLDGERRRQERRQPGEPGQGPQFPGDVPRSTVDSTPFPPAERRPMSPTNGPTPADRQPFSDTEQGPDNSGPARFCGPPDSTQRPDGPAMVEKSGFADGERRQPYPAQEAAGARRRETSLGRQGAGNAADRAAAAAMAQRRGPRGMRWC
ncbi:hypothetical protein FJT64_007224 [Amphibalanus amphitrite]|uniref:Uncharacterized protein n=1 Tax=Amphibalanus amphitrite TaxID=1232801 RepID=A0A6A4VL13_AMPAM|nr:hypothetical protein FJT64_007224 [Amphibalanus amphitrite]